MSLVSAFLYFDQSMYCFVQLKSFWISVLIWTLFHRGTFAELDSFLLRMTPFKSSAIVSNSARYLLENFPCPICLTMQFNTESSVKISQLLSRPLIRIFTTVIGRTSYVMLGTWTLRTWQITWLIVFCIGSKSGRICYFIPADNRSIFSTPKVLESTLFQR